MSNIDKRALRERAESTIGILENIAGFEPSDIDGDTVELRFETEDGFDTGCEVSIVDQCQKAADVIRALQDELEGEKGRTKELESQRALAFTSCNRWADKFRESEAKLEAAEKRAVEMPTFDGYVPHVARELQAAFRVACDNAGINITAAGKGEAS